MKKLFQLTILSSMLAYSCKEPKKEEPVVIKPIEVTQQQNAVFFDISATWCGPCGTYGIPGFNLAIEGTPDKSIAINTHVSSSDLGTTTGQELADFYKATSIPTLACGNEKCGAYTDPNYTKGVLLGFANTIWSKVSLANTKLEATVVGDKIKLKTHTKFFADAEIDGKYRLSVWMTEDGVKNRQNHNSGGYIVIDHNHLLRASLTPTFGQEITPEKIMKDKLFSNDFSVSIAGKDPTKLTMVAVIWKEYTGTDGKPTYKFVNADKIKIQ